MSYGYVQHINHDAQEIERNQQYNYPAIFYGLNVDFIFNFKIVNQG